MTKKKVLVLLLFWGIFIAFIWCDENGSTAYYETPDGETNVSDSTAQARAAEQAVCDAVKIYQAAKLRIYEIEKEYAKKIKALSSVSDQILKCIEKTQQIKKQQEVIREKYEQICIKADAMNYAYKTLSETYRKYEVAGDPVRLSDGSFSADYVDFEAQDYLNKFTVYRKYNHDSGEESFGQSWNCSLDSRIVRLIPDDLNECVNLANQELYEINNARQPLQEYNTNWPSYPNAEVNQYLNELTELERNAFQFRNLLLTEYNNTLTLYTMNRYVQYGRYRDSSSTWGSQDFLKYLDENGEEFVFINGGNNVWKSLSPLSAQKIQIFSITENGKSVYKVVYKNGIEKYYSEYGILYKTLDKNGNEEHFFSENGKIVSVELKTGEVISIKRNDEGLISEISGPVSGTATYEYENAYLKSVTDNNGVKVSFKYDSKNYLTEIEKADGCVVSVGYDKSTVRNKTVCVSITDENGFMEKFEYKTDNEILHTISSGSQEVFKLNDLGNTIYKRDLRNQETLFTVNELGLITAENRNGFLRNYYYNEDYELVRVTDENGGVESFEYQDDGGVINHIDADGFYDSYDYDTFGNIIRTRFCGNIISSIDYYSNGLIKSICEDNRTVNYEYNNSGSVTRRVETNLDFSWENTDEVWIYDDLNRVSKYILNQDYVVEYDYKKNSYGTFDVYENLNDKKKVIRKFNGRNREYETEETDLQTNTTYTKKCVYDGKGQITKIFLNDALFAQYSFLSDGNLKSYEVWNNCKKDAQETERQSIFTEYQFDDYGYKLSESRSSSEDIRIVQLNSFCFDNNHLIVKNDNSGMLQREYEYDNRDFLIRETAADGYWKNYNYSKAGRLIQTDDSRDNKCFFYYKTDGTVCVVKNDFQNNSEEYFYDEKGLLVKSVKAGLTYRFIYDSYGNIVERIFPDICVKTTYDIYNRKILESVFDSNQNKLNDVTIVYNDETSTQTIKLNNDFYKSCRFDAWNRIVEENGGEGCIKYQYDILGNCISRTNQNGKTIFYDYAADGGICKITYPDGRVLSNEFLASGKCICSKINNRCVFEADYNENGFPLNLRDFYGNTTEIGYSDEGLINRVCNYDTGCSLIKFYGDYSGGLKNKIVLSEEKTSVNNRDFKIFLDSNGKVVKEENQLGKTAEYSYDSWGNLKNKTDFSGKNTSYSYDYSDGTIKITGENETCIIKARKNLEKIEYLENGTSKISYEYNGKELLCRVFDQRLQTEVNYSYDKYNRCIRKYSDIFDFSFAYDEAGRLSRIDDKKSRSWFTYEYDENSYSEDGSYRISVRKDSNGNVNSYGYNQYGEKVYSLIKNNNGELLRAEIILYDDKGRICLIVREDGSFQQFSYDLQGRLESALQKWNENFKNYYAKEAFDCGINTKDKDFEGSYVYLSEKEKTAVTKILQNTALDCLFDINKAQYSWIEKYSYNDNGSLVSIKNPVAAFIYEYDSMNRLVSKHGGNSRNGGKSFVWDADGNLVRINGHTEKRILSYGAFNRLEKLIEIDYETGIENVIEYSYDALGRLIFQCKNGKNASGYMYDGFSNNVILVTPVMENGMSAVNTYSEITLTGEGFRTDNQYFEYSDVREIENSFSEYNDYRVIVNGFSAFGEDNLTDYTDDKNEEDTFDFSAQFDSRPYVVLSAGSKPLEIVYLDGTSATGYESEFLYQNALGNTCFSGIYSDFSEYDVWGNPVENGKNQYFGGAAFRLQGSNVMYHCGLRTYFSEMNSFSTQDPLRAGSNWFGYCVCDPVNYIDKTGCYKEGLTDAEKAEYASYISEFAKYDIREMDQRGSWNGIPVAFNCAEVSSYIDYYANKKMGIETISVMEKKFAGFMENNNIKAAADSVCSKYIYSDEEGKNAIQTSASISDLSNAEIVTPGTLLVWSPDEKISSGHTMTVLARSFDPNGNVNGFTYIEGHLSINRLTELDYCSIDKSLERNDISQWRGTYKGTYELYGANTSTDCSK